MTKPNPRSERAMREAVRLLKRADAYVSHDNILEVRVYKYGSIMLREERLIAIFDLRDCYRKRKPLTGINKRLRRAVRGKR